MKVYKAQLKKIAFFKRLLLFSGCIFTFIAPMFYGGPVAEQTEFDLYVWILVPSLFLGVLILMMSEQIHFEIDSDYLVFSETPGFWDQRSNSKIPLSAVSNFQIKNGRIHFKVFDSDKSLRIEEYDCINENGVKVHWQKLAQTFGQNKSTPFDDLNSKEYQRLLNSRKIWGRVVTLVLGVVTIYRVLNHLF